MAEYGAAKRKAIKDERPWHSILKITFGDQWTQKLDEIREKCIEPDTKPDPPSKE